MNEQGGLHPQLYLSLWLLDRPAPKGEPFIGQLSGPSGGWPWGGALSSLEMWRRCEQGQVCGEMLTGVHLLSLPSPHLGDSSKGLKSFCHWVVPLCGSLLRQDHVDEDLVCIVKVTWRRGRCGQIWCLLRVRFLIYRQRCFCCNDTLEGARDLSRVSFCKSPIPFVRALPVWYNYFPKAPPCRLCFQHVNLGRHNIQPISEIIHLM